MDSPQSRLIAEHPGEISISRCVYRRHFHQRKHLRFAEAGLVELSPLLTFVPNGNSVANTEHGLKEKMVRFRNVTFDVDCVCCTPKKTIAKLALSVLGTKAVVECQVAFKPEESDTVTKSNLELVFKNVKEVVEDIGRRERFNGFTVADLVAVAGCVSYVHEEIQLPGQGQGHQYHQ